jgi:hypothetical protein
MIYDYACGFYSKSGFTTTTESVVYMYKSECVCVCLYVQD